MNQFKTLFGFNNQLIQFLRLNPLNVIVERQDNKGALYVGNIYAAYNVEILNKHDINVVLTVAAGTGLKYKDEHQIKHMIILADDIEHFNLSRHFDKMIEFIHAHRQEGKNILIHCFAGISRSSTACIAYMMQELGFTFKKALAQAKQRRKEIDPNSGFQRQLQQFEMKIKSSKTNNPNSNNNTPVVNNTINLNIISNTSNTNSNNFQATNSSSVKRALSTNQKEPKVVNEMVKGSAFKKTVVVNQQNKQNQQNQQQKQSQNSNQSPETMLSKHKGIVMNGNKINVNNNELLQQLPVSLEENNVQQQDQEQEEEKKMTNSTVVGVPSNKKNQIMANPQSPEQEFKTPQKKLEVNSPGLKNNQLLSQSENKNINSKNGLQMSPDKLLYIKNYSQNTNNINKNTNNLNSNNKNGSNLNSNVEQNKGPYARQLQYRKMN